MAPPGPNVRRSVAGVDDICTLEEVNKAGELLTSPVVVGRLSSRVEFLGGFLWEFPVENWISAEFFCCVCVCARSVANFLFVFFFGGSGWVLIC